MAIVAKRGRSRLVRNLIGQRFGRLVVKARAPDTVRTGTNVWWLAFCDCGQTRYVPMRNLIQGNTKSCGCLRVDHGIALGRAQAANLKNLPSNLTNLPPPTIEANRPTACQGSGSVADQLAHVRSPRSVAPEIGDGGFHEGGRPPQEDRKIFRGPHA